MKQTKGKKIMLKHTPGPWQANPIHGKCAATVNLLHNGCCGRQVARVGDCGTGNMTAQANAALIAAAPDMLTALEALFEHCVMIHKHWGDNCNRAEADAAQAAAQAAIAKAKGGVS